MQIYTNFQSIAVFVFVYEMCQKIYIQLSKLQTERINCTTSINTAQYIEQSVGQLTDISGLGTKHQSEKGPSHQGVERQHKNSELLSKYLKLSYILYHF